MCIRVADLSQFDITNPSAVVLRAHVQHISPHLTPNQVARLSAYLEVCPERGHAKVCDMKDKALWGVMVTSDVN
jgi:hypothetical protein